MRKTKKTAMIAAVLSGVAMLTSCNTGVDNTSEAEIVYGPPIDMIEDDLSNENKSSEDSSVDSSTTEFNPNANVKEIADVYGPPIAMVGDD